MAAARPPQQSHDDGPAQADGGEHDEGEVASYEVGAGVPASADDAARRPFLRAVLSDGTRTLLDEEGDREVVVHDRFARLDAGLPPLPNPADDADAENLSPAPFVHRPSAPPARPAAADSPAERPATERSPAERSPAERSGGEAGRSTWQHLAPPPPRPLVMARSTQAEEPALPAEPAPPAVAATRIVPDTEPPARDREPRSVVSFFAEDDEDDEPRSVDFESAADELTEPVTDRYAPSNAEDEEDEPQPTATRFEAAASDEDDQDAPPLKPNPPWRRSIFRAFSG